MPVIKKYIFYKIIEVFDGFFCENIEVLFYMSYYYFKSLQDRLSIVDFEKKNITNWQLISYFFCIVDKNIVLWNYIS